MSSFIGKTLISIAAFVVIAIVSTILLPYLLTSEHYGKEDSVHSSFPIVLSVNGGCTIVVWSEYKKSREKYAQQLLTLPSSNLATGCVTANGAGTAVLLKDVDNNYQLTYRDDNYTYWSKYSIVGGVVKPISFRFSGTFIVIPIVFIGLFGTAIFNWVVKQYITRRSGGAKIRSAT